MQNTNPARALNPNEFFTLMQSFDGPIAGKLIDRSLVL